MSSIFRKTGKGLDEIETRAHRLPPRLRSALILVDGKRSEDDLRPLLGAQAAESLAALLSQAFIEHLAEAPSSANTPAAPSPAAAAPAATPAPIFVPQAPADFASQRRDTVRAFNELLGPAAESLSMKMEKAATPEELLPLVQRAAQLVAAQRGRPLAEAFYARFGPR